MVITCILKIYRTAIQFSTIFPNQCNMPIKFRGKICTVFFIKLYMKYSNCIYLLNLGTKLNHLCNVSQVGFAYNQNKSNYIDINLMYPKHLHDLLQAHQWSIY